MQLLEAEFEKRVNLGNYEHENYKVSAKFENNSEKDTMFGELKEIVDNAINPKLVVKQQPELPFKKEEVKVVKEVKEEVKVVEEVKEEIKEEAKVVEAPKAKEKKTRTPKKEASPFINYDRTNDKHKARFLKAMDVAVPEWKTKKELVKGISLSVEGLPFLDEKDEFCPSFIEAIKAQWK